MAGAEFNYAELVESCSQYNHLITLDRQQRLPFLDAQTGIAQVPCNLWRSRRERRLSSDPNVVYTYPSRRWRKKKNPVPPAASASSVKSAEIVADSRANQEAEPSRDSNDANRPLVGETSTLLDREFREQFWYDDYGDVTGEDYEDPSDTDDYEELTKRKRKKKSAAKTAKKPSTSGDNASERPFSCSHCGMRYKTKPGLHYHMRHHHSEAVRGELSVSVDPSVLPGSATPKVASAAAGIALSQHDVAYASARRPGPSTSFRSDQNNTGGPVEVSSICDLCLGDVNENKKTNKPEQLISCSDCGRSGHPSCLQFTTNMVISTKKYGWQCIECKSCAVCGTSENDEQLLFCDDCDRGFHMYCLMPKLLAPPEGTWSCLQCEQVFSRHRTIPDVVPLEGMANMAAMNSPQPYLVPNWPLSAERESCLQEVDDRWELIFTGNSTLWLGASDCPTTPSIQSPVWTSWWDPSAWVVSNGAQPLLHSDMVPGKFDIAIFHPQAAYRVNISLNPSVGRLFFGAREQTNETLHQYFRAAESALQFSGTSLSIARSECKLMSGCPSENTASDKINEICKYVQCDQTARCTNSFRPVGHCCHFCGATFKFSCQDENINALTMQRDAIESRYLCPDGAFRYAITRIYNSSYCQAVVAWQRMDGRFDASAALSCLRHIKERYELEDTTDLIVSSERASVNYGKIPALPIVRICLVSVLLLCLSALLLLLSLIVWQYSSVKEQDESVLLLPGTYFPSTSFRCFLEQLIRFRVLWSDEDDDRVHFELTEPSDRKFENPTYLQMLQRENVESEELLMAAAEFYRIKGEVVAEKF
ncbi:hypothetical protein M513_09222 [Trichuris suis]|uniref:Uncharacterized protein n=1 Tax=Trichuris suis TaxID=68888 RepID=A0A085LY47_9BILA|nr:hypothetical protein M513_09222 [Trichuris suis]